MFYSLTEDKRGVLQDVEELVRGEFDFKSNMARALHPRIGAGLREHRARRHLGGAEHVWVREREQSMGVDEPRGSVRRLISLRSEANGCTNRSGKYE